MENCWTILGIAPTTDEKVVKKAYAKALKQLDTNDVFAFQELESAFQQARMICGSKTKRQKIVNNTMNTNLNDEILKQTQNNLIDKESKQMQNNLNESLLRKQLENLLFVEDTSVIENLFNINVMQSLDEEMLFHSTLIIFLIDNAADISLNTHQIAMDFYAEFESEIPAYPHYRAVMLNYTVFTFKTFERNTKDEQYHNYRKQLPELLKYNNPQLYEETIAKMRALAIPKWENDIAMYVLIYFLFLDEQGNPTFKKQYEKCEKLLQEDPDNQTLILILLVLMNKLGLKNIKDDTLIMSFESPIVYINLNKLQYTAFPRFMQMYYLELAYSLFKYENGYETQHRNHVLEEQLNNLNDRFKDVKLMKKENVDIKKTWLIILVVASIIALRLAFTLNSEPPKVKIPIPTKSQVLYNSQNSVDDFSRELILELQMQGDFDGVLTRRSNYTIEVDITDFKTMLSQDSSEFSGYSDCISDDCSIKLFSREHNQVTLHFKVDYFVDPYHFTLTAIEIR